MSDIASSACLIVKFDGFCIKVYLQMRILHFPLNLLLLCWGEAPYVHAQVNNDAQAINTYPSTAEFSHLLVYRCW